MKFNSSKSEDFVPPTLSVARHTWWQRLAVVGALMLGLVAAVCAPLPPQLQLRGKANEIYVVEASTDLRNWNVISTNVADAAGRVNFNDANTGNFRQRFYRGRLSGVVAAGFLPGRVLVKPKPGVGLSALNGTLGVTVLKSFPAIGNLQIIQVPGNILAETLISFYRQSGLVQYAEPDALVRSLNDPNDFDYQQGYLWNLRNLGQEGGTPGADISASLAWDIRTSANNVIVAVIDTGVRYTHEDLAPNMWTNPGETPGNGVDDDGDGYVDDVHGINTLNNSGDPNDDYGHGSHVSGTIGGAGNNSIGVVGVCWNVQIMALKFLDSQGNGSISDAIKCIDYARSKGAKVINASWGTTSFTSQALHDAIASARDADIIFAAAAGNSSGNNDVTPLYPASYELDNIISVAATTRNDALAGFSNYGATNVDLGAPGSPIFSCWNGSDSSYQYLNGSSMAAAHVSGVAALVRAFHPDENYHQIINRIYAGVDLLPGLIGKCATGGRLNVFKALGATPPLLPIVAVIASDANATEPSDTGSFVISRTGNTALPLTVKYSMSGTAQNGNDYQTLSGTVTIGTGSSSTTVTVTPLTDAVAESPETAVLTLSANAAYTVGSPGSATVTILDAGSPPDKPVITLSALDPNASETGSDQGVIRFHRTGDTSQPIQVNWTFSGTAVNGADFEELPTTSPFPQGLSDADLTITPIDDAAVEGSETVTVTLVDGPGYWVGSPSTATITIADNDAGPPLPAVTVTASDADASEPGGAGVFTVTRSGSTTSVLTVNYSMSGSAQNGTDYQTLSGTVAIPTGASSANITVTPIDDAAVEGNETVVFTISANSAYTVGSPNSATVTVADNDQPPALPTVTITASDATAAESGDTGAFTLSRSGSTASALTVDYSMSGTAQNGTDYQTLPGSVMIAAGSSAATISLTPVDDVAVENLETAVLTITANSAYAVGSPNSATVTIADNDQPATIPTVSVSLTDTVVGESGPNPGVITVSRTGNTASALTVKYVLAGTAQNGVDYQSLPPSVTIPAGSSSSTVTVTPIDDREIELPEVVLLTLSPDPAYNVGLLNTATITITDNDLLPLP